MEPRSQDTFTSVYGPQFPSTTKLPSTFHPSFSFSYSFIHYLNELKKRWAEKFRTFISPMSYVTHLSTFRSMERLWNSLDNDIKRFVEIIFVSEDDTVDFDWIVFLCEFQLTAILISGILFYHLKIVQLESQNGVSQFFDSIWHWLFKVDSRN